MSAAEQKEYPDWAPQSVIYLRNEWANLRSRPSLHVNFPTEVHLQILDKLLKSRDMKDVWREIIKLAGDSSDEAVTNFAYNVCLIDHRWSGSSKKTRAALRSEINNAADKAKNLANELTKLRLDTSIAKLLESAHREKPYANQPAVAQILDSGNAAMLPSLSDVLLQLVKSLEGQAAIVSPITGQPNRSTSERNHFVREMERYVRRQFGRPLYRQIGVVSGVIFQEPPIDYGTVNKICHRSSPKK